MHVLQTLFEEAATPHQQDSGFEPTGRHYWLNPVFAVLAIVVDNATAVMEIESLFTLWAVSVCFACVIWPIGVAIQRVGSTKQSWSTAITVASAVCALVAIPTPAASLAIGFWAAGSFRAAKRARQAGNVIDIAN